MKSKKEGYVYEYFKVDEMFFVGKHKDYVDQLWTQNKIQESLFSTLVELYAMAAIVGLIVKRKGPEEKDDSGLKRTVQMQQITGRYQTLITIMRLVLIMDDSRNLSLEQRLESAFAIPEDEDTYKANMELFNSYVRGGVEYLYEQLILKTPDIDDDYTDYRISNIVSLISNPLSDTEL